MSRIGKTPINLPAGVTITVNDQSVDVKGPKGTMNLVLHPQVSVTERTNEDSTTSLLVTLKEEGEDRAVWGTMRSLLNGMVKGVTDGWSKSLELNGVGFKMNLSGQTLKLSLGFSHDVEYKLPAGITGTLEGNVLTIAGIDKQLVGVTASEIRSMKKPEPYKGKGFKYTDEVLRRKVGKAAKGE